MCDQVIPQRPEYLAASAGYITLGSIMNQVVRKAEIYEFEEINFLIKHSARTIQSKYYEKSNVESALELISGITELIESGNLFVIEFENQLIACGGICPDKAESQKAEIRSFFVHPNFARKGLATSLLKACEKSCLSMGIKSVCLTATLAGEPFYKKCGFMELQRFQQSLSNGQTFELVKMQKELQA